MEKTLSALFALLEAKCPCLSGKCHLKKMQLICIHRKGKAQAQLLLLSESQQDGLVLLSFAQQTPRHMELMQVSGAGRVCFLWIFQKEQAPQQGFSCSAALGHFTAMPPWKWHATAVSIQRQADFQPSLGWSPPPAEDYCHNHSSSRLSTATMSNSKHFLTTVS